MNENQPTEEKEFSNTPSYTELNSAYKQSIEKLDDSQRLPVFSASPKIAIEAPAGSGKTTVLTDAIAAYRNENVNDRIWAITFTRAATAERESRLDAMGVRDVKISTIHLWSGQELKRLSHKYQFHRSILRKKEITAILIAIVQDYLKTHKQYKSINVSVLQSYVMESRKMSDVSDSYRHRLNTLEARYIAYKQQNHLYDGTDLPTYLRDVLIQYNDYIDDVDAIFVDEFQDVDPDQLAVLDRVKCRKKFYIGDNWQAIYGFRGCCSKVFDELTDFEHVRLKYNYRSYQEIINYATNFYHKCSMKVATASVDDDGRAAIVGTSILSYEPTKAKESTNDITCVKGTGGLVISIDRFGDQRALGAAASERLCPDYQDTVKKYIDTYHPTFLCRTNKIVNALRDLGYSNVSTIHGAKGLEYENVVVVDSVFIDEDDINVAYVALTRAKDTELVINWGLLCPCLGGRLNGHYL